MDIRFIGAGALSQTSLSGNKTYAWPTTYKPVKNDLVIVVQAGWGDSAKNTTLPTPSGYTLINTATRTPSSSDHVISAHYRILDGSESAPVVNLTTTSGFYDPTSSYSYFLAGYPIIYRSVYKSNPLPDGSTAASATANLTTDSYTPAAFTTSVNNSVCISIVSSGDANTLILGSANGFTARTSGASYNSASTNYSQYITLCVADKVLYKTGSATQPTWKQTAALMDDGWVAVTTALAPYQWQPMPGMLNIQ